MSAHDDHHGGRFEPTDKPVSGAGLSVTARCDECQRETAAARKRARVRRGPLRGLFGMVCGDCARLARGTA